MSLSYIQKAGKWISWEHIESLFLQETSTVTTGVRLAHKLSREHVWLTPFAKKKVNLADQVIVCTFCVIVLIVSYYFLFCIKGYDWPVHWNLLAMTTPPRLGDSYG